MGILSATYEITSVATGKVLDVPEGNAAANQQIQQFTGNGGANQHWKICLVAIQNNVLT